MSGYLLHAESLCEARQKIIVSREQSMEHVATNAEECTVRHFKIDGGVITDPKSIRCDYLLLNDDNPAAYFIELKRNGKISEAIDQIWATIELVKHELPGYIYHGRIVCKGVNKVQASQTVHKVREHRKRYKGSIIQGTNKLEENI